MTKTKIEKYKNDYPYIIDDVIEEHSCFNCGNFGRKLYWNTLYCMDKKREKQLRFVRRDPEMMYKHPKRTNKCKFWKPWDWSCFYQKEI